MAFAVGNLKTNSNLKMIDEEGKEHFGGKDNMDTSHLRLLDEQAQQEAGPKVHAVPRCMHCACPCMSWAYPEPNNLVPVG